MSEDSKSQDEKKSKNWRNAMLVNAICLLGSSGGYLGYYMTKISSITANDSSYNDSIDPSLRTGMCATPLVLFGLNFIFLLMINSRRSVSKRKKHFATSAIFVAWMATLMLWSNPATEYFIKNSNEGDSKAMIAFASATFALTFFFTPITLKARVIKQ